MPLPDYQSDVERLQRGLARAWLDDPTILNLPGTSLACKLDPLYYLAVQPSFSRTMGRLGGMFPDRAMDALVRTGLLITRPPERTRALSLAVVFGGRTLTVKASFLDADFVDRAVKLYGGAPTGLEVADLRITADCREDVETFFADKTPPGDVAYA